jgi:hypothetical protein
VGGTIGRGTEVTPLNDGIEEAGVDGLVHVDEELADDGAPHPGGDHGRVQSRQLRHHLLGPAFPVYCVTLDCFFVC